MSDVTGTANRLLKRLSRGMQALLLSVVALGATVLLWTATLIHSVTWKEFLNAIATGLLVSAAFGIAQALITSRVATELLRASVVEEVSRSLAQSNNAYYPANEFPASTAPDPLFNSRLTQDLENSSTFWFRGLSARYAAARLALNQNVSLQAHFILPDPKIAGTFEGRVDYAVRHQIYPDLDIDGIRGKIKRDVTLYSSPGQGTRFPRTLRFSASSVIYLMQQADCLQTRNHPSTRLIQFPRSLTRTDMLELFHEITGEILTNAEQDRLTDDFKKFADDFARTAGIGRHT
jgi:hypothetical protein